MFDFCKLDVYQKAKSFCISMNKLIAGKKLDKTTNDQLRRASLTIMLNMAEGSSLFSNKDRRNFMVVARGSTSECAEILEYLYEISEINQADLSTFTDNLEQISKMLFGLTKNQN